jgi:mRNA-degrading endonuclease toxin of MazEF toxin-antitoxin module
MVEQIKSIDYQARNAKFIEKAPQDTLNEVLSILDAIVY